MISGEQAKHVVLEFREDAEVSKYMAKLLSEVTLSDRQDPLGQYHLVSLGYELPVRFVVGGKVMLQGNKEAGWMRCGVIATCWSLAIALRQVAQSHSADLDVPEWGPVVTLRPGSDGIELRSRLTGEHATTQLSDLRGATARFYASIVAMVHRDTPELVDYPPLRRFFRGR